MCVVREMLSPGNITVMEFGGVIGNKPYEMTDGSFRVYWVPGPFDNFTPGLNIGTNIMSTTSLDFVNQAYCLTYIRQIYV